MQMRFTYNQEALIALLRNTVGRGYAGDYRRMALQRNQAWN